MLPERVISCHFITFTGYGTWFMKIKKRLLIALNIPRILKILLNYIAFVLKKDLNVYLIIIQEKYYAI
jgi:hypothetical protein